MCVRERPVWLQRRRGYWVKGQGWLSNKLLFDHMTLMFIKCFFFFLQLTSIHKTWHLLADFASKKKPWSDTPHKLINLRKLNEKQDETSEFPQNRNTTKFPTESRERRAAVEQTLLDVILLLSFNLISSYISYYSHRFLGFFLRQWFEKKGSGANSIQHAYRFDTLNLHFVAVLFACVSSSILPIKSWNNFQSKKQQGAALFSSVSESHYLNHSLDPFSQFFPNTLIYWNNAVLLF